MGNLCTFDTNPLDAALYARKPEECIRGAARECAQAVINQVLTVLPMRTESDGIYAELPEPVTPLPRELPLPKPKEPTKWYLPTRSHFFFLSLPSSPFPFPTALVGS